MTDQPRDPQTGQFVSRSDTDGQYELTADQFDPGMRYALAAALGDIPGQGDDGENYYETFNWVSNPTVKDYFRKYLRNPYARAVVDIPINTAWRDPPTVVDEAETGPEETTTFEAEVEALIDEVDLWHYARRAHKLASIGEYGVLVMEFDDIDSPESFAEPVENATALTGLRPFSQASVDELETGGPGSGRWGEPTMYRLDLTDEDDDTEVTRKGPDQLRVHHSRVIHIPSKALLDDEIRGTPALEPVFNAICDIEKTLGSSAELAYRATAWGLAVNMESDFNLEDGGSDLADHLQRWYYGLEPIMRLQGAEDVKSLGGEDIDPQPVIQSEVEAISAQTGIPQSVLKGNETGERATTEDIKEWYGKVGELRTLYATPRLVRAPLQRCLDVGVLTPPRGGGFDAEWDPLAETSAMDQSEIRANRGQAAKQFQSLIPAFGSEEWRAFLEDGEISDLPDNPEAAIEPGDVAALEEERQRLMNDGGQVDG
jgi:hypothetical protein